MSDAYLVRRGGGGSSQALSGEYAVIGVEYPSGSTCTCTKGGTTLTARETNGAVAFNIPSSGNWTVTITDGTNTKSKTVSITYEGQVVRVRLAYSLDILTEDSGLDSDYSLVNTGSGNSAAPVPAMSGNAMVFSKGSGDYVYAGLSPAIDLTDYSKLIVTAEITEGINWYAAINVGFGSGSDFSGLGNFTDYLAFPASDLGMGSVTRELDISGLTGSYYLGVGAYYVSGSITSISLE